MVLQIKKNLKSIEIEPKLYFIILGAVVNKQALPFAYTHWGVYYTLEEAKEAALRKMKEKAPPEANVEKQQWHVVGEVIMPAADIEALFEEHKEQMIEEARMQKSVLMKKIIDASDMELFHRHIKQFNRQELQFIKDSILKGQKN